MTREAIKKIKDILEEATETDDSVCYVTSDDADALKAAIKVLEQTRWIPCSERMPDDDEDYLVIDDKGECGVGYYHHTANAWDSTNFGWLEGMDRVDDYLDMPCGLSKVVAWMPLPELYKGEREEEK